MVLSARVWASIVVFGSAGLSVAAPTDLASELCPATSAPAGSGSEADSLSLLQTQARLRSATAALSQARREAILQQARDLAAIQSGTGVTSTAELSKALKRATELSAVLDWDEPPAWTVKDSEPSAQPQQEKKAQLNQKKRDKKSERQAEARPEEDEDDELSPSDDPLLQEIMSYDWNGFDTEEADAKKAKDQKRSISEQAWDSEYQDARRQTLSRAEAEQARLDSLDEKEEKKKGKVEDVAARQSDIEERLLSEAKAITKAQEEEQRQVSANRDDLQHQHQQQKHETVVEATERVGDMPEIEKAHEDEMQAKAPQEFAAQGRMRQENAAEQQQTTTRTREREEASDEEQMRAAKVTAKSVREVADEEQMQAARATARRVHEMSAGFTWSKNTRCGDCGAGNDAAIAADGTHFEFATRETAEKTCGAVCTASHLCGGFNFVESLGNCYYRRTTSCQQGVDEDRDCFTKAGAPPFRAGDAAAPLPPILSAEGADVLGATAADMAPRLDSLAAELGRMREALGGGSDRDRGAEALPTKALPAIGFVKTHRTGGSTVVNVLQRLGESRNLTFFMPPGGKDKDAMSLGWPEAFPGPDAAAVNGPPTHQFDVLCHDAVYDDEEMRAYLRPVPFFFTVLRRPAVQISSAFTAYKPPVGDTWDQRIGWLERLWLDDADFTMLQLGKRGPRLGAQFMNPQAHDLGWYQHVGGTAFFDQDDAAIMAWIGELKLSLGFVMLTEYFDEGLVLLGKRLGLEATDLAHILHERGEVVAPQSALKVPVKELLSGQAAKVEEILHVDTLLYGHFNRTFWHAWEEAGGHATMGRELEELKRRNLLLETACASNDAVVCPWSVKASVTEFTEYVKKREAHILASSPDIM